MAVSRVHAGFAQSYNGVRAGILKVMADISARLNKRRRAGKQHAFDVYCTGMPICLSVTFSLLSLFSLSSPSLLSLFSLFSLSSLSLSLFSSLLKEKERMQVIHWVVLWRPCALLILRWNWESSPR